MPNRLKIELDLGDKPVIESSPLTAHLELAVALGRHGRGPARQHRDAARRPRPRRSRATPTSRSTTRRARSTATRSPCSTTRSTTTARRRSPKSSICRATCPACSTPRSSRACSSAAAHSASTARARRSRRSIATSASNYRRVMRRATCCSRTRSTPSSSPPSTRRASPSPCRACRSRSTRSSGAGGGNKAAIRSRNTRRAEATGLIQKAMISTKDGRGQWQFEIKYPEWGRYLVRACDLDGGHCTGRVFYIDWPSWAGAQRDQSGPSANILTLTSDKQEYQVGETAIVQLPEASQGRALLTLENGSGILEQRWLEVGARRQGRRESRADSDHGHHGAQRVCGGDDGAAARGQDQRPADPPLRRDPAQGVRPEDEARARDRDGRRVGAAIEGVAHGERIRGPRDELHARGSRRRSC